MKRLLFLVSILCLVCSICYAEETKIHTLWDIDMNKMNVQQIHDYLDQEKGIQSKINRQYNSLRSMDNQELTLVGYPFTLYYGEYNNYKTIDLDFRNVGNREDAYTIINAMIDKYGQPTFAYYDMYNRSNFEWKNNIGEPMYHQVRQVDSINNIDLYDTLLNWEYYEENKYTFGDITLYIYIDNVLIKVRCGNRGNYSVYVEYFSIIPSVEIEEVDESQNIPNYVDTGF